ncbi:Sodium/potassium-transporting ATPase subunit beta-1 [Schistosoma japonicum]|uniref:Sodium/potassium-transporting ATPase subunit beta-1 n=1 Tax=Schistosoma japonicum TaxID=6182 RepID=A0A4Z2DL54_SCHJA|nr:Sodium/potassium-transporting ATPase subunit beta-1 [Schistosoma japonicum]
MFETNLLIDNNNQRIRKCNSKKLFLMKENWFMPTLQKFYNHIHYIYNSFVWRKYLLRFIYLCGLYSIIAVIFTVYMYILFYFTILADYPRLTGLHNQLKFNPGLSMVPNPSFQTSLINFRTSNPVSYSSMMDEMTGFLSYYQYHLIGGMFASCEDNPNLLNMRRPCRFNLDSSGPCNLKNGYGYYEGKPCFAIKLNRIYGWLPEPLNNYTGVLLKCQGLTEIDSQYLGKICYYDTDSLKRHHAFKTDTDWCDKQYGVYDSMFYPYLNQGGYQSPLVFVHFSNVKRHVIIWIKCYALAKNINSNDSSIIFQILID